MKIEEIKNELETEGYLVMLSKNGYLAAGQENGFSEELGSKMMKNVFRVSLLDNQITVNYFTGQIAIKKELKTIEELLKFVRQVFPLEE
ncbi:hypothetical protein VUJ46_15670 [Chryseobacterium sp. MYb264]|uniref:hypothetical protein n=1 Tax=Chryseobacterium sp. MYb264 TaxID=2745153 RepID=UPI002E0DDDC2|nr:hypothetical protein VUJ46_15670 [Chryseobacterium sp. MYb264]